MTHTFNRGPGHVTPEVQRAARQLDIGAYIVNHVDPLSATCHWFSIDPAPTDGRLEAVILSYLQARGLITDAGPTRKAA